MLHKKGDYHACIDIPTDFLVMNSVSNLKSVLWSWSNIFSSIAIWITTLPGEKQSKLLQDFTEKR